MNSAIQIRRLLDKLFLRKFSIVGNGLGESLIVFKDRIYSIDTEYNEGKWCYFSETSKTVDEKDFGIRYFTTPCEKKMIIELIKNKYGSRVKII